MKETLNALVVILLFAGVGFFYFYATHPLFSHPVHWLAAYSPKASWFYPSLLDWNIKGKDGGVALHYAIRFNPQLEITKFLIQKSPQKVNALDNKKNSPLFYAINNLEHHKNTYDQYEQKAKVLIQNGANPNLIDKTGQSLLHYIAKRSKTNTLLALSHKMGAHLKILNKKKESIVWVATSLNPHVQVSEWLLKMFPLAIKAKNQNHLTLLHKASAKNKNPEVINLLLQKGADISAKDKELSTALHWAVAFNSNPKVVRALVQAGSDVNAINKYGESPLLWGSAHSSHPEVLRELILAKTFRPALTGQGGASALHRAGAENPNPTMIRFLVGQGYDVNAKDDDGNTPLHYSSAENPHLAVLDQLLLSKADPHIKDHYGNNALHLSAKQNKNVGVLKRLLEKGVDVNALNQGGDSPLHIAVSVSFLTGAKALLNQGAKVHVQNKKGESPLHLVAEFGDSPKLAQLLLAAGAKVNLQDNLKQTPLHRAVKWGYNGGMISLLLQTEGVDPCLKDSNQRVPMDYAEEYSRAAGRKSYQKLRQATVQCGM